MRIDLCKKDNLKCSKPVDVSSASKCFLCELNEKIKQKCKSLLSYMVTKLQNRYFLIKKSVKGLFSLNLNLIKVPLVAQERIYIL